MADRTSEEYARLAAEQQRTARLVATTALVLVCVLAAAGIVWLIDNKFGNMGLVIVGTALFTLAVFVLGSILARLSENAAGNRAIAHHNNVLEGLTRFQEADDRGEIARTVISQAAQYGRGTTRLDNTVLRIADGLARRQLTDGAAAAAETVEADWYGVTGQPETAQQFDESRW